MNSQISNETPLKSKTMPNIHSEINIVVNLFLHVYSLIFSHRKRRWVVICMSKYFIHWI